MKRRIQGKYVPCTTPSGREMEAFIPVALPPEPPIDWTPRLRERFDQALMELSELDGLVKGPFVAMGRKKAMLSSMFEGTEWPLFCLLLVEPAQREKKQSDEPRQSMNHIKALLKGQQRVRGKFSSWIQLIRELHAVLLGGEYDGKMGLGEFRKESNWLYRCQRENVTFVPPPHTEVSECMGYLEEFLNDRPVQTEVLLKAALAYVQFETIHPFSDGNGRMGRLLITLILCEAGILCFPMLHLGLYFKQHWRAHSRLLDEVQKNGDWEAWLEFFAEAVIYTASETMQAVRQRLRLPPRDQDRIK